VFQVEEIVGTAAFNSPFYMDLSRDMARFIRRSGWRDSVQETHGLGGGQVIDGFLVLVYLLSCCDSNLYNNVSTRPYVTLY